MKGLVSWFAENSIAANLLMIFLLVGGLTSLSSIDKEVMPSVRTDIVRVTVSYRGAGPKEVEQQICLRIEEALEGTEGMEEMQCVSSDQTATASIEAATGFPIDRLLNSVKSRVDAINTFPVDAERPIVEEMVFSQNVLSISLYGDLPERELKEYGESLREELLELPDVPLVNLSGTRDYEVSIEVSEEALRRYNLTFDDISNAVNAHSVTLPGGTVQTPTGDVQIQARNQAYNQRDFAFIPVKTESNGATIYLFDVANIVDGFVEDDLISTFEGMPAVYLNVQVTDNPNVIKTVGQIEEFIAEKEKTLPSGLHISLWQDSSDYFEQRINTLLKNGIMGLALVFILLIIFLRPKVAIWVAAGIGIAFVATLFALPAAGISINGISLFAFILVLGIVVDDAIIIGENIHRIQEKGTPGLLGAKLGVTQMAKPVFFAVTTSIVVFIPLAMMPGDFGSFLISVAIVPMIALAFSLIESLLILPAHLSHMKPEKPIAILAPLDKVRNLAASSLRHFLVTKYRPFLHACLARRFFTLSCFAGALILCIGMVAGGIVKTSLNPGIPLDTITTTIELPVATPFEEIEGTLKEAQAAADKTRSVMQDKYGIDVVKDMFLVATGNRVEIIMELVPPEVVDVDAVDFRQVWRDYLGPLPQAEKVLSEATFGFNDKPIELELSGRDLNRIRLAAGWAAERLKSYPGTYGVEQSLKAGRPEMEIVAKDEAYNLGLGLQQISNQARQAFFGQEAQRIPRGREDVRVMIRYPKEDRETLITLQDFRIRTNSGTQIPFDTVAETRFTEGFADITRIDGHAIISVTSDFNEDSGETAGFLVQEFMRNETAEFETLFPDVNMVLKGEQLENQEFMGAMLQLGLLAMLAIYGLLAIEFKSWWQPGLIISAIPFGFAGAIVMHLLKGDALSMLSFFGILASAGVVVNDTLVLIDRINELKSRGHSVNYAIVQSARDRFRPIMLTTITTFVGLTPIMLETSLQAQFLIPMAMSLAFGVVAASIVTLIMIPSAYSLWTEIMEKLAQLIGKDKEEEITAEQVAGY